MSGSIKNQRIFGRAVIVLGLAIAALLIAVFSSRGPHAPAWAPVPMHKAQAASES